MKNHIETMFSRSRNDQQIDGFLFFFVYFSCLVCPVDFFFDLKSSFGGLWLVLAGFCSIFGAEQFGGRFVFLVLMGSRRPLGVHWASKIVLIGIWDEMLMIWGSFFNRFCIFTVFFAVESSQGTSSRRGAFLCRVG